MGLTLSTLTLTERSLKASTVPSPLSERAREVANIFITDRGGRRGIDVAVSFLRTEASVSFELAQSHAILKAITHDHALPDSYGLKGGAAREHLIAALNIRTARPPRDIDLIRRGRFAIPADDEAAKTYMARDYLHGARVELVREIGRYLGSRDLTINEVASFDGTISTSILGLLDTIGHVLRPSYYRGGTLHRKPSLDGRILLKMIRLFAEGECANESWSVVGIPEETSFSEFDLAIHLNKAFQRDVGVAERFLHSCAILSLIPARDNLLYRVLDDLEHLRHGERGVLPDVPAEEWARALSHDSTRD